MMFQQLILTKSFISYHFEIDQHEHYFLFNWLTFWMLCVSSLQDALASFDFLNKRNSMAVKQDLDGGVEQDIQHPDLELTALHRDTEIR